MESGAQIYCYANYTEQRHLCVYKSLEIMGLEKFNPIIYTI